MNSIIITAVWGMLMMIAGAFIKSKKAAGPLAITGLLLAFGANAFELLNRGQQLFKINTHDMLRFDAFNLTFIAVVLLCTFVYMLLNTSEMDKAGKDIAEYYALIFFVLCGISIAASYTTLLMLFIGVEIISIPLYILTGSDKRNMKSNEAALKYFLMGSFSTGIMLMGIAFIYGGNTNASFHIDHIQLGLGKMPVLIAVGLIFMLVALSFKASAAPFHFWTPDVYDGAPTVFTSFMSTVVKGAVFFAFLRLFEHSFGVIKEQWQNLIVIITGLTLFIGNIGAVFQQSVKRMLAYSSIAQAGFMLFAIFAMNDKAREGIILYTAAYSLATMGIFGVLIKLEDYTIDGFNGLSKRNPTMAFAATVCLLSLTGVPLTAGFQSKFFMLMAAVDDGHRFWLVIAAVLFAAISAYYYFRIIQAMYFKEVQQDAATLATVNTAYRWILILIVVSILLVGIYPELIVGWMYR